MANNFRSATIIAPLTDTNPETGERLDYRDFSASIEQLVRDKYETDAIKIRVTGFAKIVGDLIEGAAQVALFFLAAFIITKVLLLLYSRCYWATLIPLLCSTVAVVWQLGLLHTMGFGLDPYSMLVPFLVFAIGISHGVQIINNVAARFFFGVGALLVCAARIPGPVHCRLHRADLGRHRLPDAGGHRDPGDPGTGTDGQHWRRRTDLHQPVADAGAAVLHGPHELLHDVRQAQAGESVSPVAVHRPLRQAAIRPDYDHHRHRVVCVRLLRQQGLAYR